MHPVRRERGGGGGEGGTSSHHLIVRMKSLDKGYVILRCQQVVWVLGHTHHQCRFLIIPA